MVGVGDKSVIISIHGRVQGVWFRAWTTENAVKRGLRGWVRNREDGSVEALFCGPPAAVDEMIEACRCGPRSARVERIDQTLAEPVQEPGFHQLPTA
jgi:acylphosphatase